MHAVEPVGVNDDLVRPETSAYARLCFTPLAFHDGACYRRLGVLPSKDGPPHIQD
jgi:hypothetical protein